MTHPARFSAEIVDVFADLLLAEWPDFMGRPVLHDPFAGSGERLLELCNRLNWGLFSGTEIEASFIEVDGVLHGSATDPSTYPPVRLPNETVTGGWVVITSPAYPNGMSDHHAARDDSKRYTYRKAVADIEGADRPLHEDNMGRYGYRGTRREGRSEKRKAYWDIAERSVRNWGSAAMVLLNVSDFVYSRDGVEHVEPVVADWQALMRRHGWDYQTVVPVGTRRMGNGENRDKRVDAEYVIVCRRTEGP